MKALIQKELRENVKLAALGLFIFALILVLFGYSHMLMMKSLAAGEIRDQRGFMQPLAAPDFWRMTGYFCAIFAAVLGWFQIHHERHRDLWAFLVHRPAPRTEIFLGKVIAGLALYALVAVLPLTGYVIWALVPGHVAAPFEWIMLRPVAAHSSPASPFISPGCSRVSGRRAGMSAAPSAWALLSLSSCRSMPNPASGNPLASCWLSHHPGHRRLGWLPQPRLFSGPAGAGQAGVDRRARTGKPGDHRICSINDDGFFAGKRRIVVAPRNDQARLDVSGDPGG